MVTFNLKLTLKTVDNDLEVKLTHTANYGLTRFFVRLNAERRIFFGKLSKTNSETIQVLLSLRLYGDTDHGIGEVDSLKSHRSVFVTDCISSTDILETYTGTDITTADHLHGILAIRVHLEETRDPFLLTRT